MTWQRSRSREQKEQRIAEIVDATARLYQKHSFEDITFALIAKEADFTRSNLYKCFNTKE
jgi:AcrR family transcriptional regulator